MLLRPPFIQEQDVKSQSSNQISHYQRQPSVKSSSKNKKKQNSLGMKKNNSSSRGQSNLQIHNHNPTNQHNNNYDSDNQSVHSVNSRKSKSKAKQSTIAIGKNKQTTNLNYNQNTNQSSMYSISKQNQQGYQIFKLDSDEDDNRSIGSHTSKNSKKNVRKQSSLGKNRNNNKGSIQVGYYFNNNNSNANTSNVNNMKLNRSPEQKFYAQEYSKVQTVEIEQPQIQKIKQQPYNNNQHLNYNSAFKLLNNQANNGAINSQPNNKPANTSKRTQRPNNNYNNNFSKPQSQPQNSYSPFEQITLKRQSQSQDQPPVYVLKQPSNQNTTNVFAQRIQSNNAEQKKVQNPLLNQVKKNLPSYQQYPQQNNYNKVPQIDLNINKNNNNKEIRVDLQQSHTIQPQMISTKTVASKSRRNKIFDNDNNNSIANTSNVMTSRSNMMEGSFQRSRSKSKSKLGNLLKQSRQKKQIQKSQSLEKQKFNKQVAVQNQRRQLKRQVVQSQQTQKNFFNIQKSNLVSVTTLHEQSRIGGQKLGQNVVKMKQIQKKKIDNQIFDLGQSQLDLNLSMSNRLHQPTGLKGDSLHFNFQPQKKKGISITSKQKPNNSQDRNKSIESKKHLDRLMKKCQQNQQFLAKSILSNGSQLLESRNTNPLQGPSPKINKRQQVASPSPNISKKQQNQNRPFEKIKQLQVQQEEPVWYDMVKNNAQFKVQNNKEQFKIKQVERKQVKKLSQQQIKGPSAYHKQSYNLQSIKLNKQQKPKPIIEEIDNKNNKKQHKNHNNKNNINNFSIQQNSNNTQNRNNYNRQKAEQEIMDRQSNRRQQNKIVKQSNLSSRGQNSTLTHELSLSQNGSERSNSQRKNNKKKQSSLNIIKRHKIQVRDQSPRAEQSFYQQSSKKYQQIIKQIPQKASKQQKQQYTKNIQNPKSQTYNYEQQQQHIAQSQLPTTSKMQSSRQKAQYKKPNLINFQSQEQQQSNQIKSKTDMNFYNYTGGDMSQRSMRPPSSKPPLSRKSNCSSSKSKSKTKQNTLNINVNMKKQNKISNSSGGNNQKQNHKQQNKTKKKTLLDIAQDKDYQGSAYDGSNSQCSFNTRNSRESFESANSKGSRKSSGSKKQTTLPITIKHKDSTLNGLTRPPLHKIESTNSQVQVFDNNHSIYSKLQQNSNSMKKLSQLQQRQSQNAQIQQRTIVSKNTYFIDEKGRLVKQDLVIQGNKVYGRPNQRPAQQMAYERMRRSRQHHRSRSKSRQGNGQSRLSRKNSQTSFEQSGSQSRNSSSNYYNNQNNFNDRGGCSTGNYQNPNQKPSFYIQQFIKPIQQPVTSNTNSKFQKPSFNSSYNNGNHRPTNNKRSSNKIEQQFYQNQQQPNNCYQSYYNQQDDQPVVQNITLNQLFGRNKKSGNNSNSRSKANNQRAYEGHNNKTNDNNNKYGDSSKYGFRNVQQQSGLMGSSSVRKKSLSRTQKNFYNNR